jgi:H+/Cl- antiporter ClcA
MELGKHVIVLGIILIIVGIIWIAFNKYLSWIGNLPGDLKWEYGNTKIYVPIATMFLISLLINICYWVYKWLFK